jgi:FixJ family two-component response regulator
VRAEKPDLPGRLILDVEFTDINGLDLQKQIAERSRPPIVFIMIGSRAHTDGSASIPKDAPGHQRLAQLACPRA